MKFVDDDEFAVFYANFEGAAVFVVVEGLVPSGAVFEVFDLEDGGGFGYDADGAVFEEGGVTGKDREFSGLESDFEFVAGREVFEHLVAVVDCEAAVSGNDWFDVEAGKFDANLVGFVFGGLEFWIGEGVIEADWTGDVVGGIFETGEEDAAGASVFCDFDGESYFGGFAGFDAVG